MSNIYWVGPRQSDIEDIEQFFKGSITIYGDNRRGNIAYNNYKNRINHNITNEECENFFQTQLQRIIDEIPDVKFIFYNQEYAYCYGQKILEHSIGVNSKNLLEILNDKAQCRYLLSDTVDVIPYVTLKGKDCYYENLKNLIPEAEFVLQKIKSCGGDGTFHITSNSKIIEEVNTDINGDYILSPFINGISLNIHILIIDSDIILFPPSVQIVCELHSQFLYFGADYLCYQSIGKCIQELINEQSKKIGLLLQKKGYRGVLGIDYLLHNGTLYFMELNPRFQASTQLLNHALYKNNKTSLQELHINAFQGNIIIPEFNFSVDYSNFVYTSDNISECRLHKVISSPEIWKVQLDGYTRGCPISNEKNIYLCRCIFARNICTISNGTLLLHPNIFTEEVAHCLHKDSVHYKEYMKFALLNHGVTLTTEAQKFVQNKGTMKNAVFDAIDITIFGTIKVNVPISCKFNSLSPFTIDAEDNCLLLLFDNELITPVTIELVPDSLENMRTSSNVPYEAIINLATDRIRINPAPVCVYKKKGLHCHFCNLPEENYSYNLDDIKEVIDYCIEHVTFRHFLIGGGTYSVNGGWDIIKQISQYIRSKCSKDIYLMSIPPKNPAVLHELKQSGITEVAFNIEIFDRDLAKQLMPAKGAISLSKYLQAYDYATKLWGSSGKVRSLLIYGFDSDEAFISGIEKLCSIGVEPIISVFRPLSGTVLENANPPATLDVFSIYEKCKKIAEKYSLCLGPDCTECQNNTLSFPV